MTIEKWSYVLKVGYFQKDFLLCSNSSKKRTKQFNHSTVRQKNEFIRSFFGRIVGLKKTLRLCLTFSNADPYKLFFWNIHFFIAKHRYWYRILNDLDKLQFLSKTNVSRISENDCTLHECKMHHVINCEFKGLFWVIYS